MAFFRKKKEDNNNAMVVSLRHHIKEVFGSINNDISHIKQWVNHFSEKNSMMEDTHNTHRSTTQKDIENINHWIHFLYKHNQEMQTYVKEVTSNLIELHKKDNEIVEKLQRLELEVQAVKKAPKTAEVQVRYRTKSGLRSGLGLAKPTKFEQKVIYQLKSKRKEYVVHQVLNLVNEKKYSTKELEEKIVREKGLCGRTTFYDYLKELRNKKIIGYKDTGVSKILIEL